MSLDGCVWGRTYFLDVAFTTDWGFREGGYNQELVRWRRWRRRFHIIEGGGGGEKEKNGGGSDAALEESESERTMRSGRVSDMKRPSCSWSVGCQPRTLNSVAAAEGEPSEM
jgi:hypothetical protein